MNSAIFLPSESRVGIRSNFNDHCISATARAAILMQFHMWKSQSFNGDTTNVYVK